MAVPTEPFSKRSNNGHRGHESAVNIGRAFRPDFGVIPLPQLTGPSPCEAPRPDSLTRYVRLPSVPASLDPIVVRGSNKTGHRIQ
jgi:hypothetical protein